MSTVTWVPGERLLPDAAQLELATVMLAEKHASFQIPTFGIMPAAALTGANVGREANIKIGITIRSRDRLTKKTKDPRDSLGPSV
ncbi:MAG TPA: hypothetical protein VFE96_04525 [Candidatus Bathyarchaeia archaeon]|jgi:hypothetical protein|nr:hypothetical protein [Candidatus Bathyarchaeia archaeon]